ncbi:MAG: DUF1385 domain-containing protein [Acidimicrobiales bacterium]
MKRQPTRLGGQALIEGVMVRSGDTWAAAARGPDGSIVTVRAEVAPWTRLGRRIPVMRGMLALVATVSLGMRGLSWSRTVAEGDKGQTSRRAVITATVFSVGMFVGVFALVPAAVAGLATGGHHGLGFSVVEAAARLVLFVGYVAAIGRLPGIQRTFEYHGAEHQAIGACEAGDTLDLASVRRYSPRHARCGTDFLVLVAVVAVLAFALVSPSSWWALALSRVLLLPVVAGLAYEVLRVSDRPRAARWLKPLMAPGLAVQRLTTRVPTDDQIEVAIVAVQTAIATPAVPDSECAEKAV